MITHTTKTGQRFIEVQNTHSCIHCGLVCYFFNIKGQCGPLLKARQLPTCMGSHSNPGSIFLPKTKENIVLLTRKRMEGTL